MADPENPMQDRWPDIASNVEHLGLDLAKVREDVGQKIASIHSSIQTLYDPIQKKLAELEARTGELEQAGKRSTRAVLGGWMVAGTIAAGAMWLCWHQIGDARKVAGQAAQDAAFARSLDFRVHTESLWIGAGNAGPGPFALKVPLRQQIKYPLNDAEGRPLRWGEKILAVWLTPIGPFGGPQIFSAYDVTVFEENAVQIELDGNTDGQSMFRLTILYK